MQAERKAGKANQTLAKHADRTLAKHAEHAENAVMICLQSSAVHLRAIHLVLAAEELHVVNLLLAPRHRWPSIIPWTSAELTNLLHLLPRRLC